MKGLKTFMKFLLSISHVIPHNLNHVCELFEIFDNFHVMKGGFQSVDHKYVENQHFDK